MQYVTRHENKSRTTNEKSGKNCSVIFNWKTCFYLIVMTAGWDILSSVLWKKMSSLEYNVHVLLKHSKYANSQQERIWLYFVPTLTTYHIEWMWFLLCICMKMLGLTHFNSVCASTKSPKSSLQPQWQTCSAGLSHHSCMVRTQMSGLTCGMLGVFHKINLAEKNRLHTLPHPIIHVRPTLLSSYKRLSHWCYPQQQLC